MKRSIPSEKNNDIIKCKIVFKDVLAKIVYDITGLLE